MSPICLWSGSPAIKKFTENFPEESQASIANLVALWQDRKKRELGIQKDNNAITPEEYKKQIDALDNTIPEKEEIEYLIFELRYPEEHAKYTIKAGDEYSTVLDNVDPYIVSDLIRALNLKMSENKKTKTITITSNDDVVDNVNLFRALLADLIYNKLDKPLECLPSERERLDLYLRWERINKLEGNVYELAQMQAYINTAKRNIRAKRPEIDTRPVMERLREQCSRDFTVAQRKDKVSVLTEMFSRIVTSRFERKKQELLTKKDELEHSKDAGTITKEEYDKEIASINSFLDNETRDSYLRETGPRPVFEEMRNTLRGYLKMSDDELIEAIYSVNKTLSKTKLKKNIAAHRRAIEKMLRNFYVLRDDVCRNLELTELLAVRVSLEDNEIIDRKSENQGTVSVFKMSEDPDVEDQETDDPDAMFKENWMYEYDTVSNWSKMSVQVRHLVSHCPDYDDKHHQKKTSFGDPKHVDAAAVNAILLDEMVGARKASDMIGILQVLQETYGWAEYLINELSNNQQLMTLFMREFRVANKTYAISSNDADPYYRNMEDNTLKILNRANEKNAVSTAVKNNLLSGTRPDPSVAIYGADGELNKARIRKLKEIRAVLDADDNVLNGKHVLYMNHTEMADFMQENPTFAHELTRLLNGLGFIIDDKGAESLLSAKPNWFVTKGSSNLAYILTAVDSIFEELDTDSNIKTTKNLVERCGFYYNDIAATFNAIDTTKVERSIRENGKSRYSKVKPSQLDDFVEGVSGQVFDHAAQTKNGEHLEIVKKTKRQWLEENYGKSDYYRDQETGEWRLAWLQDLWDSPSSLDYIEVLNADTNDKNKQEYDQWLEKDRLALTWSMWHQTSSDPKHPGTNEYWYPIPVPSDTQTSRFIKFGYYTHNEIKDWIKEEIKKEAERMLNSHSMTNMPQQYRDNADKFCMLPMLNSHPDYSVNEILEALDDAFKKESLLSEADPLLEDLAEYVLDTMKDEFKQQYVDFTEQKIKEGQARDLDNFIENQGFAQLNMLELFCGDPAFYSSYADLQKRAKQFIVPLEHIDAENPNFKHKQNEYGQECETVLHIQDPGIRSAAYDEIMEIWEEMLHPTDGSEPKVSEDDYLALKDAMEDIKHTDGQGYRFFESMRRLMYALGEMDKGDKLDQAYERIANGTATIEDFGVVRTAIKPFVSGLLPTKTGRKVGKDAHDEVALMPIQYKLSEQMLISALAQARGTMLGECQALQALEEIAEKYDVDAIVFDSALKEGNNGSVQSYEEAKDADGNTVKKSIIDFENDSKDEIVRKMSEQIDRNKDGLLHLVPWYMYGIVTHVPDAGQDNTITVGTQLQKMIIANIPEDATFTVNGQTMNKSQIIEEYNKIWTLKIKKAYTEITGEIANTESLSRMLIAASRTSSRNSAYLERAFSLDENGNFIMPLCDMSTLNLSSELLNSVIRKATTKISVPGAQFVQMSSFGMANKLKVRTEVNAKTGRRKLVSVQALVPMWAKDLIDACSYTKIVDGKPVTMISSEYLPDELRRAIGVRIPTQGKQFILPIEIVDFVPPILGDTIVLPADVVVLMDSDYDVDKVPTILPAFKVDRYDDERKVEEYNKYLNEFCDFDALREDYGWQLRWHDSTYDEKHKAWKDEHPEYKTLPVVEQWLSTDHDLDEYAGGGHDEFPSFSVWRDLVLDTEAGYTKYRRPEHQGETIMSMGEWAAKNEDKFRRVRPIIKPLSYKHKGVENMTDAEMNNYLIDIMTSLLTSKDVATQVLASGGDVRVGKICDRIQKLKGQTKESPNPASITTVLRQQARNNDGKNMIAVFAVAEAMHSIAQFTNLELSDAARFSIFRRGDSPRKVRTSLHDIFGEDDLSLISNIIGESIGASADNAKKAKLNILNVNNTTANVACLLLRLGYTIDDVGLFLNIPAIRHFTETGDKGIYDDISDDSIEAADSFDYTIEEVEDEIRKGYGSDDTDTALNEAALTLFLKLQRIGKALHQLDMLCRNDSGSTSPHGPLENTLARMLQYRIFEEDNSAASYFRDDENSSWRELFNTSFDFDEAVNNSKIKIAQAFTSYGTMGAFKELSKYYPGLNSKEFMDTLTTTIREMYGGYASPENVKEVMYAMYNYMMSSFPCFRRSDETLVDTRNYYINEFPAEAAELIAKHPQLQDMTLVQKLQFGEVEEDGKPFISLMFDGTMLPQTRDSFTSDWETLFYSPEQELHDFAIDLFKYCYYRNGFRFTSGSFAHLAPLEARLSVPGYKETLDAMLSDTFNENFKFENFRIQFLRNNLWDRNVAQTPSKKQPKPKWLSKSGAPLEGFDMPTEEANWEPDVLSKFLNDYSWYYKNGKPRQAIKLWTKDRHPIFYILHNTNNGMAHYVAVEPLGWGSLASEYDAMQKGLDMPSVYDHVDGDTYQKAKLSAESRKARKAVETGGKSTKGDSEGPSDEGSTTSKTGGSFLDDIVSTPSKKGSKTKTKTTKSTKKKAKTRTIKQPVEFYTHPTPEAYCAETSHCTLGIFAPGKNSRQESIKRVAGAKYVGASYATGAENSAKAIADKIIERMKALHKGKLPSSIVLNITGEREAWFNKYNISMDDVYLLMKDILDELDAQGLRVRTLRNSGQSGVAQAAAHAARYKGKRKHYTGVDVVATPDYKFEDADGNIVSGRDEFVGRFGKKYMSEEAQARLEEAEENDEERFTWARKNTDSEKESFEVSSQGDELGKKFSALNATFAPGTVYDGMKIGGRTIEDVYQNLIKKSGKGRAPAKTSKLYNPSLKTNEEKQNYSYENAYLPLWKIWAEQNPKLMQRLRTEAAGKVLTDAFANTLVSQARALSDILNDYLDKEEEKKTEKAEGAVAKKASPNITTGSAELETDPEDVLTGDKLMRTRDFGGSILQIPITKRIISKSLVKSTLAIIDSATGRETRIAKPLKLVREDGSEITTDIFVNAPAAITGVYQEGTKYYSGVNGERITENIYFMDANGDMYDLNTEEGYNKTMPWAIAGNATSIIGKDWKKFGVTWLDANGNPIC